MGGFGNALKDIVTDWVHGAKPGLAHEGWELLGAKDAVFHIAGQDGEAIGNLHKMFQLQHSQNLKMEDKPVNELQQHLFDSKMPVSNKETPLSTIHTMLQRQNHPAAQISRQLLNADPSNAGRTLNQLKIANVAKARTTAGAQVFGDKFQNLNPILMPYLESNDPVKRTWAQSVLDVFSNELHDTSESINVRGRQVTTKEGFSKNKAAVAEAIDRENKVRGRLAKQGIDVGPKIKQIDIGSTYKTPKNWERASGNVLRTAQLSLVALKHLSQYGNLSSIHANQLVRGLLSLSDAQFRQHLDASAILAFTEHDMMDRQINGRFGKLASFTNPTAGDLFYRSYHMPFFDYLRTKQLTFAASVGYNAANDWAMGVMHGDRRAALELKEMGLDVGQIIQQGGKLTDEQKVQAMFHFTNNRFFMDKSIERSLLSNKSAILRSATMYHTFVNAQQRFMRRELGKMWEAKDIVGIGQFAATIGILFPAVAPMIKSLEIFGRTLNYQQAKQSAEDDYDKIWNGSFGDKVGTYLDLLSHYGAFGIYTSYVQAARTHRLMYQIAGPTVGTIARGFEDLGFAIAAKNQAGRHNAAPVVRDIMEDTIPVAGNIMAHHLAPTTKEQNAQRGHKISHFRKRQQPDAPFSFSVPGDF